MKTSRMRAAFAAAALALVALVAVPSAATAVGPYTPSDNQIIVSSPTVRPGGTVTISFLPGSFNPGTVVSFTLVGEYRGSANLANLFTVAGDQTLNKVAKADGSLENVALTLPANASGTYTLTGSAPGWTKTWVFTVEGSGGAGTGLATTGSNNDQLLALWIGGGALAFIGGGLVVATAVRKQRKQLAD